MSTAWRLEAIARKRYSHDQSRKPSGKTGFITIRWISPVASISP